MINTLLEPSFWNRDTEEINSAGSVLEHFSEVVSRAEGRAQVRNRGVKLSGIYRE